ncbi:MAG: hypothetical protein ACJ8FY_19810 [Gemmataceae bacterium]
MAQDLKSSKVLLHEMSKNLQTHNQFAAFVRHLTQSLHDHPEEWQNQDLPSYLEALAAWVDDMEGYYKSQGATLPLQPSWRTLAEIMLAARVYE